MDREDINFGIAVAIRDLRNSLGLTRAEFAQLVGKPQLVIDKLEFGMEDVDLETLIEISVATKKYFKVYFI